MAQIDLKNAKIYIRDGYVGTGGTTTVNNVAGYPAGAVTMTVNAVGTVAVGDVFRVAGDPEIHHRVTAQTGSPTTSITFTPALGMAVVDTAVITWLPHEVEVDIGEGAMSYTEKRNMEYKKSRGKLKTVREGDEEAMDVRMDFIWEFLRSETGATVPTIEEALKKIGAASDWVSSAADPCEPYAVDVIIEYIPPCEDVDAEVITLNDYRWESLEHDAKAGTVSTQGKCHSLQASVARVAV